MSISLEEIQAYRQSNDPLTTEVEISRETWTGRVFTVKGKNILLASTYPGMFMLTIDEAPHYFPLTHWNLVKPRKTFQEQFAELPVGAKFRFASPERDYKPLSLNHLRIKVNQGYYTLTQPGTTGEPELLRAYATNKKLDIEVIE